MTDSMAQRIGDHEVTTIVTDEPWSENCYVVRQVHSGAMVLIDPGGNEERIVKVLQEAAGDLKAILLTHAHHDHVGAVAALQEQLQVPCYLHRADQRLLRQAHTYALVFAARAMAPILKASFFDETDFPQFGQLAIEVIPTPGHSLGSVAYHFGGFVFTGDTLLYQHVGRADTPGSDEKQLIVSVDRLLGNLSEETVILSGHGRTWNCKEAKIWWQEARIAPPQYKKFGGI